MSLTTIDFRKLQLHSGDRVLDLGCGEGRHAISACLEAPVHVVGLDLSVADLDTARTRYQEFSTDADASRRLNFLSASALHLPFADATFDKVICAEVLEHIHDYERVLAEIRRVLKPGGLFAVSVPRFGPEWICWQLSDTYHEVEGGHIRIFRRRQLQQAIERTRMYCYARHWAHGLHSPYWWLRCAFWKQGESNWLVRNYHRLLVWDLMQKPALTRWLEAALNPFIGKSVVMYFVRGAGHAS
ncbi:MAG: class I SAM-dependent methyltransferase [Pseudomonadales bacterium]|nr:class I SAM-dependent methyltransferase [Pseudomonadales bacterium]